MTPLRALAWTGLVALALPAATSAQGPAAPQLGVPLACEIGRTCEIQHYMDRDPGPGVLDYRCGPQTYEKHSGIDIRLLDMAAQRRGVDVLAAAPGRVARLRDGVADISIRAPGAPSVANQECGNGVVIDHGGGWETQYCHMARGSLRVKVGDAVAAGAPLGRVGLSGATEFPHLHMTVRQAGRTVDPFAPATVARGACNAQAGLWTPQARAALGYKLGAVLNAGFSTGPVTAADIEAGGIPPASRTGPYLVAYARAITLQAGDVVAFELKAPDGAVLASATAPPLPRWQAQGFRFVGKKTPPGGWPAGTYVADYRVLRNGKVAVSRRFEVRL